MSVNDDEKSWKDFFEPLNSDPSTANACNRLSAVSSILECWLYQYIHSTGAERVRFRFGGVSWERPGAGFLQLTALVGSLVCYAWRPLIALLATTSHLRVGSNSFSFAC